MGTFALVAFTLIFGFSFIATAQDRDPAALPLNVRPPKKPRPFTLGFQETFYLADKNTLLGAKHFEEVGLRVRGQGNSDFLTAGIDVGASYAINIPDYLSVFAPEAYFRFVLAGQPSANSATMTFGRKKDRWSLLDSFWELGAWQPLYRWDYLRPEEQGLIGVFLEVPAHKEVRFLVFATPLFVPESGPTYKLRNGKLVSQNPWFFEPTEQLMIINNATDVRYDPHIPPIEEIVLNGAVGASVELGARSAGSWLRGSYVYKPRNQIGLPFEGVLQISGGTPSFVDVDIYPRAVYHHLSAVDLGYKTESFSIWLSTLLDQPVDQTYPATYTYQELKPAFLVSPGIEYSHISENDLGIGVVVSYLNTSGEEPVEKGSNASSSNPIFGSPYSFTNALRGAVRFSFASGTPGLRHSTGIALTQSFQDDASWLKLTSEWMFSQKLRANLEADFIGSLASRSNNNFLSRYRGNDRIIAGASLIF